MKFERIKSIQFEQGPPAKPLAPVYTLEQRLNIAKAGLAAYEQRIVDERLAGMDAASHDAALQELESFRAEVAKLEAELANSSDGSDGQLAA